MPARSGLPPLADLSRIARKLPRPVRRHLDTAWGVPTHALVTPAALAGLKRRFRDPDPRVRADALLALSRLICRPRPLHPAVRMPDVRDDRH